MFLYFPYPRGLGIPLFTFVRISPLPCGLFRFLAVAEVLYRSLIMVSIDHFDSFL